MFCRSKQVLAGEHFQAQVSSAKKCMAQVMRQCGQMTHFVWNDHSNICRCVEKKSKRKSRPSATHSSGSNTSLSSKDYFYSINCTGQSTRHHTPKYPLWKFLRIIIQTQTQKMNCINLEPLKTQCLQLPIPVLLHVRMASTRSCWNTRHTIHSAAAMLRKNLAGLPSQLNMFFTGIFRRTVRMRSSLWVTSDAIECKIPIGQDNEIVMA